MTVDKQIRTALKNYLLEIDPDAEVYAFDTLSHDPGEWANLFRKDVGEVEKIHGWVIRRTDITDSWERQTASKAAYVYEIWGFYGFRAVDENDNSDDEFQAIVDAFCDKLRANPRLGLCGGPGACPIDEHELPQFKRMTTLGAGGEQLHFAPATLKVKLCARIAT